MPVAILSLISARLKPANHWEGANAFEAHHDNSDRHDTWNSCWLCLSYPVARSEDRKDYRGLHLAPNGHFPAPDQDDHSATGVFNACGWCCPYGRYQSCRPYRRESNDLVRRGVASVAAVGHDTGQRFAAW